MDDQKILKIPAQVRSARLRIGLSQAAMATRAGMDQSFLCAIERGRRRLHSSEQLKAIALAAELTPYQTEDLFWAFAHDRTVLTLQASGMSQSAQRIVSLALNAERILARDELVGLERTLERVVRSKRTLVAMSASDELQEMEARMS